MKRKDRLLPTLDRRKFFSALYAAGGILASTGLAWASTPVQGRELPTGARPGDWPLTGCDLRGTRSNVHETRIGPSNVGRLKVKWTFEGAGNFNQATPVVVGDTLYFSAWDGYVYALEARSGALKWKFNAWEGIQPNPPGETRPDINIDPLGEMRGGVAFGDGRIFFGAGTGRVHCLNAETGREIWHTLIDPQSGTTRTRVNSDPIYYNGKVFVGLSTSAGDGQAVCLDAGTGAIRWSFDTVPDPKALAGGSIWSAAAIDVEYGVVYNATGSLKGHVAGPMLFSESMIANDMESGELLWYNQLRDNDPFDLDYSCHPMLFEATHPTRSGGRRSCVGAGSKTGFHTFDRYTGEHLWTAGVTNGGPVLNSTAYGHDKIYMVSTSSANHRRIAETATVALHAYTGEVLWWTPNASRIQGATAVANNLFYQGFNDGTLQALHVETGEPLWTYQLPSARRGGITISNGTLYTSCGVQRSPPYSLYAFSIEGR